MLITITIITVTAVFSLQPVTPHPHRNLLSKALQQKKYRDFLAVGVPAVLDLVSSGLNFIGLLYISASVWQMLRGSMIVFSAFLSILFLKRRMYGFNWLGIAVCVLVLIANISGSGKVEQLVMLLLHSCEFCIA